MCLVRRSAWVVPDRAYIPIPNMLRNGVPTSTGQLAEVTGYRLCVLGNGRCDADQDARTSCLRVVSSVNVSDSFGMLVTNGPTIQPRPVGIPRVKETDSH